MLVRIIRMQHKIQKLTSLSDKLEEEKALAQVQYLGTGRRKSSVARVRLVPGDGKIIINNRDVEDYVPFETLREIIKQPLNTTETLGSYDILVNVHGGGLYRTSWSNPSWCCTCTSKR